MYFENISQLIQMNGHGIYVWSSYAIGVSVVLAFALVTRRKEKEIKQTIKQVIKQKNNN